MPLIELEGPVTHDRIMPTAAALVASISPAP